MAIDNIQSMRLSIDQAREIFRSIKRACELEEIVATKVGELSWRTDARLKSDPEWLTIVFNGPLGYTNTVVKRKDATAAVAAFTDRFGLEPKA
jgi:hypothetical protein